MNDHKFKKIVRITLIFVFLVIVAGSVVRMTGSGMGCPDWPKCFGSWVPPTDDSQLPENYREIYTEKRLKKIERFAGFLESIGSKDLADQIRNDENLAEKEAPFNAARTWTEYINRLCGVFAGLFMLLQTFLAFKWYRKHRKWVVFLAVLNLFILVVEAWFGSIVVASNLIPWTITVHMLLALVIVAIQLLILNMLRESALPIGNNVWVKVLLGLGIFISVYQIMAGAHLRQGVDIMLDNGVSRSTVLESLGIDYKLHRSFSWAVLVSSSVLTYLLWTNEKLKPYVLAMMGILGVEILLGIIMAYADFPRWAQPAHLLLASAFFAVQFYMALSLFNNRQALHSAD